MPKPDDVGVGVALIVVDEKEIQRILQLHADMKIELPKVPEALEEFHAVRAPMLERYRQVREAAQKVFILDRVAREEHPDEKSFEKHRDLAWSIYLQVVNDVSEKYRRKLAREYLKLLEQGSQRNSDGG